MRKKLYVTAALVMAVVLLAGCGRTFTDTINSLLGRATDEKLEELEDIKESAEAEAASIREELEKDSLTEEERESLEAALAEAEETSSKAAVKIEKHAEYESSKAESIAESKKAESSKTEGKAEETTVAEGEEEPTSKAADETTAPASSVSEATSTTPAGTTAPATTKPAETTAPATTTVAPTTVAPTTVAPTTVAPTTVAPTTVTPTTVAPTTVAPTTVPPTTAHSHSYSAAVVQNPTCTANGVRRYTCSCGNSYDETIPATGHNWVASTSVIHHDAVLGTVHHDEVGHYEEQAVMEEYAVCNHCGGDMAVNFSDGVHQCSDGTWSGEWHTDYRQVGTTSVYVVDQEAYDETVIVTAEWDESVTTYKCSTCGATK